MRENKGQQGRMRPTREGEGQQGIGQGPAKEDEGQRGRTKAKKGKMRANEEGLKD